MLAISVVMSQLFECRWRRQVAALLRRAFAAVGLDRLRVDQDRLGVAV